MTHTATDFERTIPELLARNATEFGSLPALSEGTGEDARTLSWSQLRAQVAGVSLGLREIGLAPGDRLMIMSSSRIEHWVVDMAAVHARAVPCTAYATLSTEQIRYVARHSAASVLVLEGADQLQRWRDVFDELPALRRVVVLEESALPNDDDRFIGWQQLLGSGAARHAGDPEAFESTWRLIRPRDPVAMIYTSGTTGDPKGVVLSHRNVISEAVLVREVQQPPEHPEVVSYLPLAHIAGRELDIYMATIYGGHVHICQDTSAVLAALTAVRPPLFFGVPRVWEKITAGIQGVLAGAPEERRAAFEQASSLASEAYRLRASRAEVPGELADRVAAADERVLAPIRAMLGLDRIVSA
ncbi:MAG: AMP-binding protein, partial [Sciscionella sp.]